MEGIVCCFPPLHELDSGSQPIALSLGVSSYAPWDLEMADRGYKVLSLMAPLPPRLIPITLISNLASFLSG